MDEIRTIQVLPAPWDLPFPHARQALLIERRTRDPHGNRLSDGAVPGITTMRSHAIATLRIHGGKKIAAGPRRAASWIGVSFVGLSEKPGRDG